MRVEHVSPSEMAPAAHDGTGPSAAVRLRHAVEPARAGKVVCRLVAACVVTALGAAQASAQAPAQAPAQVPRDTAAAAPEPDDDSTARLQPPLRGARLAAGERIVVDGRLEHPAWQRAPIFDRFIQKEPVYAGPVRYATRVQLLFGDDAIYVGITSLDEHPQDIRAPLVRRDGVARTQDHVFVYIDAIGKRQSAQFFRVNAAGSVSDGMHTAAGDDEDIAPDFDFDAASARNAQGYTSVLRIPFSSLRFPSGARSGWRILVGRRIPREQFYLVTSAAIPLDAPAFISTMQPLGGLDLQDHRDFLHLRPSLTLKRTRTVDGGPASSSNDVQASLDAKWRPVPELVVDATFKPDFSQVALDVPQLSGNTSFALSLPEKRPFFFESSDLLRSPTEALYTRSFSAPSWGLRSSWRDASYAGTALIVDDKGGGVTLLPDAYGTDTARQPRSRGLLARLRGDVGRGHGLEVGGIVAARKYDAGLGANTVAGPDFVWQADEAWRLRGQWLRSQTSALPDGHGALSRQAARGGDSAFLKVVRQTERLSTEMTAADIGPGFRHDTGFVSQSGIRRLKLHQGLTFRDIAPFNELSINLDSGETRDRATRDIVERSFTPGLSLAAAGNTQWALEYHGLSRVRTQRGGPLLRENYWTSDFSTTPGVRMPKFSAGLTLGKLADYATATVRPGGIVKTSLAARPLPALELEPSWWAAWLRQDGALAYRESALQVLGVWHIDSRQNLRLILQQARNLRRSGASLLTEDLQTSQAGSLTYTYRQSTSTLLYVGATRTRGTDSKATRTRADEVFIKLQADLDEARALIGAR